VVLHSFFTAAAGVAIYRFMMKADVGYLDLSLPTNEKVLCLSQWPLRHQTESWWKQDLWKNWVRYRLETSTYIQEHTCEAPVTANASCLEINVPLHDMQRNLGIPVGEDIERGGDVLELYSVIFLYLTVWLWLAVVTHDLTLLSVSSKNYVLDLSGMVREFPCMRTLYALTGIRCYRRLALGKCMCCCRRRSCGAPGRILALLLALLLFVPLVIWFLLVFLLVMCPMAMVFFVRHPIRLSRALIFLLCVSCGVFGIFVAIHALIFIAAIHVRPRYAITWSAQGLNQACVCGCVFPISKAGCIQVFLIGALVTFQTLMLAFRCLKGLRRSNWANLMSVTFAVPLTVYAVEWMDMYGEAIRWRKGDEPVQGEPAFDPFAMMDEQDNSAYTTVHLAPGEFIKENSRTVEGPTLAIGDEEVRVMDNERVGCCGFPCRVTSGKRGTIIEKDVRESSSGAWVCDVTDGAVEKRCDGEEARDVELACETDHRAKASSFGHDLCKGCCDSTCGAKAREDCASIEKAPKDAESRRQSQKDAAKKKLPGSQPSVRILPESHAADRPLVMVRPCPTRCASVKWKAGRHSPARYLHILGCWPLFRQSER